MEKKPKSRYCIGCEWEFNNKGCKNDHKDDMELKHKDGSFQVIYCAWKVPMPSKRGK